MECDTASTRIWLPMDLRATFRPCTSGTPAPSSVPSIRQNRAMANCATSGPITGARRIRSLPHPPPFSDANQSRTSKPGSTIPTATNTP